MTTEAIYNKLNDLDKEISAVVKDQDIQNRVTLRMEVTIDKLKDLAESMHRLLSIHDERITNNSKVAEDQREEMSKDIKDLNARLTNDTAALASRMDAMESRLSCKIDNLQRRFETNEKAEEENTKTFREKLKKYQWILWGIVFVLGSIAGEHNVWAPILKFFV